MSDTRLTLFEAPVAEDIDLGMPIPQGPIDRMRLWTEALDLFLESRRTDNTRRAYRRALQDLLAYTQKMPWEIDKGDLQRWTDALRQQKLSKETINLKVAGVSSFFSFCANDYEITLPDGRRRNLTDYNPAAARSLRTKIVPYGKSYSLSPSEARALLLAIPQSTVQGLRDYALILTYIFTGRRNSEARCLRWGDFSMSGERAMYKWSGKGKEDEKNELPAPAWVAIKTWLKAADRWGQMTDDDYIFIPLNDHATRLKTVTPETWNRNHPISLKQVNTLLKRYARRAGLDAEKIHVHILRHTAAMLRDEAGDDIQEICNFLSHSSVAVTQIYLHRVRGKKDTTWIKVEALLGLD